MGSPYDTAHNSWNPLVGTMNGFVGDPVKWNPDGAQEGLIADAMTDRENTYFTNDDSSWSATNTLTDILPLQVKADTDLTAKSDALKTAASALKNCPAGDPSHPQLEKNLIRANHDFLASMDAHTTASQQTRDSVKAMSKFLDDNVKPPHSANDMGGDYPSDDGGPGAPGTPGSDPGEGPNSDPGDAPDSPGDAPGSPGDSPGDAPSDSQGDSPSDSGSSDSPGDPGSPSDQNPQQGQSAEQPQAQGQPQTQGQPQQSPSGSPMSGAPNGQPGGADPSDDPFGKDKDGDNNDSDGDGVPDYTSTSLSSDDGIGDQPLDRGSSGTGVTSRDTSGQGPMSTVGVPPGAAPAGATGAPMGGGMMGGAPMGGGPGGHGGRSGDKKKGVLSADQDLVGGKTRVESVTAGVLSADTLDQTDELPPVIDPHNLPEPKTV